MLYTPTALPERCFYLYFVPLLSLYCVGMYRLCLIDTKQNLNQQNVTFLLVILLVSCRTLLGCGTHPYETCHLSFCLLLPFTLSCECCRDWWLFQMGPCATCSCHPTYSPPLHIPPSVFPCLVYSVIPPLFSHSNSLSLSFPQYLRTCYFEKMHRVRFPCRNGAENHSKTQIAEAPTFTINILRMASEMALLHTHAQWETRLWLLDGLGPMGYTLSSANG